jgi:hypothetical protein
MILDGVELIVIQTEKFGYYFMLKPRSYIFLQLYFRPRTCPTEVIQAGFNGYPPALLIRSHSSTDRIGVS